MSDINTYNNYQDYIKANYLKTTTEETKEKTSKSDKDMFLNLLVKQMQYQDPLEPQDNSEFLAQMAQFTSLEQMQNISKSVEMSQASNLIGKIVTANDEDGKAIIGMVDGIKMINGSTYIRVNNKDIAVSGVTAVTSEIDASEVMLDYAKSSYASSLVGKVVSATVTSKDSEGNEITKKIEGMVGSSKVKDGSVYVVVDGNDVAINNVNEVTSVVPVDTEMLNYVQNMNMNFEVLLTKINSLLEELGNKDS